MALLGQFGRRSKWFEFRGEADVQRTYSDLLRLTRSGYSHPCTQLGLQRAPQKAGGKEH